MMGLQDSQSTAILTLPSGGWVAIRSILHWTWPPPWFRGHLILYRLIVSTGQPGYPTCIIPVSTPLPPSTNPLLPPPLSLPSLIPLLQRHLFPGARTRWSPPHTPPQSRVSRRQPRRRRRPSAPPATPATGIRYILQLLPPLRRLPPRHLLRRQTTHRPDCVLRNLPDGRMQLGMDLSVGFPERDAGARKGVLFVLLEGLSRGLAR